MQRMNNPKTSKQPIRAPRPDQSYERADPAGESQTGELDGEPQPPSPRDDAHAHAADHHPDGRPLRNDDEENLHRPRRATPGETATDFESGQ